MYSYTHTHIYSYTHLHSYLWTEGLDSWLDWIQQASTTSRASLLEWQWSKHSMWHQRLLMITDDDQNIEYDASGVSARGRAWPIEGPPPLQLLQLFTRCAQLYKNSHGFPCPVKPSTKSAPRYFSSAGHVKSTVDPSRDTGEPPAAWTFYTAPHELY